MSVLVTEERELPLPGNVLQSVDAMDSYEAVSGRYDTTDVDEAKVTTSLVVDPDGIAVKLGPDLKPVRRPVLDIDLPAKLIPSSTPGHFHLYLDVEVAHGPYIALLEALEKAGILESGYVGASIDRGYTAARLPWVQKGEDD